MKQEWLNMIHLKKEFMRKMNIREWLILEMDGY